MHLVLGTLELTTIGGVGTYLLTVSEQLERMGHGITIWADEVGEMADIASERGLLVVSDPDELPDSCGVVYAQDTPSAYALASRYPDVPQVFCLHATEHDRWIVPQVHGVTSATVTLHERAARHALAHAHVPEVVRLSQPVDTRRFAPGGPIASSPSRAVLLSNYINGNRMQELEEACADAGIELVVRGFQHGGFTSAPEIELNQADIVFGRARVIVEGLSCGRAAYVYDGDAGDGWVTPETYPRLVADNFEGRTDGAIDPARLRDDLRVYSADMGPPNRDLAVTHHSARAHAEALVDLFSRIRPRGEPPDVPLDEFARLSRMQWKADSRALGFEHEARLLRRDLARRNRGYAELQHRIAAEQRADGSRDAVGDSETQAPESPAPTAHEQGTSRREDGPEIAVVMPLADPRGDIAEHLRTWTHGQTLDRSRYQLVISADSKQPDYERRVGELLGPQDKLIVIPGADFVHLYDAAARAAKAPILVITEAHVRAGAGCLAAVAEAFAKDPALDVATFQFRQHSSTVVGELTERRLENVFSEWGRLGWTRLNFTASAVRAEAYARAGGLDSRLNLFAPSYLSARLDEQGAKVTHLESAGVDHELEEGMRQGLSMSRGFAHGECVARRELDAELCERYFGPAGLWDRRHAYRPEVARRELAALLAALRRNPSRGRSLVRELAVRVPATVARHRPRQLWENLVMAAHGIAAATPVLPMRVRERSFGIANDRAVRAVKVREGAEDRELPPPLSGGRLTARQLDGVLIGSQALEEDEGRQFRWTEPVALLRLNPPESGALLRIETGGIRGEDRDYLLGVHIGGTAVPDELILVHPEAIEVKLPAGIAAGARERGAVILSEPLLPSRYGSTDRRRLGIPVISVSLQPLAVSRRQMASSVEGASRTTPNEAISSG